jgi:uncharacterized delta-60 repeat protein
MTNAQFLLAFIGLSVAGAAMATDGDADFSYGSQGFTKVAAVPLFANEPSQISKVINGFGDRTYLVGSIVPGGGAAQQGFVVRLLPNGALDGEFAGGAGMVAVSMVEESHSFRPRDGVLTADGGVLIAGVSAAPGLRPTVCKLTSEGVLDETFGGPTVPGCRILNFISVGDEEGNPVVAVARAVDGEGYVVALTAVTGNSSNILLGRLTATGLVDETFGNAGFTAINETSPLEVHQVAVRPDGRIVVTGAVKLSPTDRDIAIVQVAADGVGQLFTTHAVDLGPDIGIDIPRALALRANGEIVVAGSATTGANGHAAVLMRFTEDLGLIQPDDTQFPAVDIDPERLAFMMCDSCSAKRVTGMTVLSDGGLLMVGDFNVGADDEVFALRLDADWHLDTTFGAGGQVFPDFDSIQSDSHNDVDPAIVLQCGDRPVVAVLHGGDAANASIAATRLLSGSIFCDGFEN